MRDFPGFYIHKHWWHWIPWYLWYRWRGYGLMRVWGGWIASDTSRPLKAKWKVDVREDLEAFHGLDAEEELKQILEDELIIENLARQIEREIDEEIMEDAKKKFGDKETKE